MHEHRKRWKEHAIPNIHEALNRFKTPEELNIHKALNIHEAERHSVPSHPLVRLLLAPCVLGPGNANNHPLLLRLIGGVQLGPPFPRSVSATEHARYGPRHLPAVCAPQASTVVSEPQHQRVRLMEGAEREPENCPPPPASRMQAAGSCHLPVRTQSASLCFPCVFPVALLHRVI